MSTSTISRPRPLGQGTTRTLECGHAVHVRALSLSTWCPSCKEEQVVAG